MARRSFVVLGVLAYGLAALPARAESPSGKVTPAYVLSIWTDEVDDQADALTQALRARVRQTPGWSLVETSQSFETLAIALKCPAKPDPPCLLRIGDQLKTDRYVWGTMQKAPGLAEVAAEVHLWTRGKADAVVRETYGDGLKDPASEPLRAMAGAIFATLTGATVAPTGPARAAAAPLRGEGGEKPPVAQAEASAPPREASSAHLSVRRLLGYSALVAGGGLLVASGIEAANWIADNNASTDDRKNVPKSVTDVCANPVNLAAQDACNKSRDAANVSTLGWVFAGVGVALVGTGLFLILTEGPLEAPREAKSRPTRARMELVPRVGPHAGEIALKVAF